ncbi:hypothetical protein JL720_17398 [Aureococcus anophagefferens]|nr:hypothetical protein JL720_17398 [Aureococcus anophagefferens]
MVLRTVAAVAVLARVAGAAECDPSVSITFTTSQRITSNANGVKGISAVDLDEDGDVDFVTASYSGDEVQWHNNDGSYVFGRHGVERRGRTYTAVPVDLDGDGDLDLVATAYMDNRLAWFENDGSMGFSRHIISNSETYCIGGVAADVDGDGDLDVVNAGASGGDFFHWWENDGSEGFSMHVIHYDSGMVGWDVAAADVDGDGDADAVGCAYTDSYISWYENTDGAGTFAEHVIVSSGFANPSAANAVDVDGDGHVDVVARHGDSKVSWFDNGGSQAFTEQVMASPTGPRGSSRATWTATATWTRSSWSGRRRRARSGSRTPAGPTRSDIYEYTGFDCGAGTIGADVDADGDLDAVSGSAAATTSIGTERVHAPPGAPRPRRRRRAAPTPRPSPTPTPAPTVAPTPRADGLADAPADDRELRPRHQFQSEQSVASGQGQCQGIFAVDADGDGDLDVFSGQTSANKVLLNENDGAMGFSVAVTLDTAVNGPGLSPPHDVDGDGDVDAPPRRTRGTRSPGVARDHTTAWYVNDGAEAFTKQIINVCAGSCKTRDAYAVDFDGDGDVDVLTATGLDDTVTTYVKRVKRVDYLVDGDRRRRPTSRARLRSDQSAILGVISDFTRVEENGVDDWIIDGDANGVYLVGLNVVDGEARVFVGKINSATEELGSYAIALIPEARVFTKDCESESPSATNR